MKQFNMRRFGLVLRLDFAEGMKPLLWNALLMLLVYLFMFWFAYNVGMKNAINPNSPEYIRGVCESVGMTGCITMYFFFIVSVSRIFRNVQKKQTLTTYLMLPASNLEKFLSRWVYMLVFSIVGGILAFFVADIFHAAWLSLKGLPVYWASGMFIDAFDLRDKYWEVVVEIYCMLGFIHAFFLLGGVLFKRYHFVATSAVGVLLLSGLLSLMRITSLDTMTIPWETSVFVDITGMLLAIIFLTCLSYWLFCRYQVVTRKFVNL